MIRAFKKVLSVFLVVIMVFGVALLTNLVGVDFSKVNFLTIKAEAATYSGTCGDNLTWNLNTSTGVLAIGGTGNMSDWSSASIPWYSYRSSIKSVSIDNGVTSIGDYAFSSCDILTSITIPDSVTSIGDYAFCFCDSLINIIIPDSVTSIGRGAFYNCTGLTSITIGNGVTSIGGSAFDNCTGLTSITIPDSVTSIGDHAFYSCDSLINIIIPDSVTSIGGSAFTRCVSLTSITIPDGVTSIGDYAFAWCVSLTNITIPDSVTSIGDYAFSSCDILTSITIPDSVTSIGEYAFRNCDGLTSITIPDGVTSIGDYAFRDCDSLTSITIPDSVTKIGDYAFAWCVSLTNITIPVSVTSIGDYAFYTCDELTETRYMGTPEQWKKISIGSYNSVLKRKIIYECNSERPHYGAGDCGENLIWKLYTDGELVISGTGYMTDWTSDSYVPWYKYRSSIKSVSIDNGVISIGNRAFKDCSSLTSVTIPDGVRSIGGYAFAGCTSLTSVTISNCVTSIAAYAFIDTKSKIVCYANSSVHQFAVDNGIEFELFKVNLNETILVLKVGEYSIITATPEQEYIDLLEISWKSSNPNIATVDENGKVTAKSNGRVTIYALAPNGATLATCSVNVIPNEYKVFWIVEGNTTNQTYEVGETIAVPANPSKNGYTFMGWDKDIPDAMPAEDLTFTAMFELTFKMSLRNSSTTTVSYGDSIILHADMNEALPSGWTVKWTADNGNFSYSANGETCTITPSKSGNTTFTVIVYDENGNVVLEDEQTMNSKAGFFDKFVAFFKKLFGLSKIFQQSVDMMF